MPDPQRKPSPRGNNQLMIQMSALRFIPTLLAVTLIAGTQALLSVVPAQAQQDSSKKKDTQVEIVFWESVRSSKNPKLLKLYLRRYPNGQFAEIAKALLADLGEDIAEQESGAGEGAASKERKTPSSQPTTAAKSATGWRPRSDNRPDYRVVRRFMGVHVRTKPNKNAESIATFAGPAIVKVLDKQTKGGFVRIQIAEDKTGFVASDVFGAANESVDFKDVRASSTHKNVAWAYRALRNLLNLAATGPKFTSAGPLRDGVYVFGAKCAPPDMGNSFLADQFVRNLYLVSSHGSGKRLGQILWDTDTVTLARGKSLRFKGWGDTPFQTYKARRSGKKDFVVGMRNDELVKEDGKYFARFKHCWKTLEDAEKLVLPFLDKRLMHFVGEQANLSFSPLSSYPLSDSTDKIFDKPEVEAVERKDLASNVDLLPGYAVNIARVKSVTPHGPASQAGLKAGDIVMSLNGTELATSRLFNQFYPKRAGETVKLEVMRGKEKISLQYITATKKAFIGRALEKAKKGSAQDMLWLAELLGERDNWQWPGRSYGFLTRKLDVRGRERNIWRRLAAETGDPKGLVVYAKSLLDEVAFDAVEDASAMLKRAANLGNAEAMYEYAVLLDKGKGAVKASPSEARDWFERAAKAGYQKSMVRLARALLEPDATDYDRVADARKHLERAAKLGNKEAGLALGHLYRTGLGLKRDASLAIEWYERVGKRHYSPAANLIAADMYRYGLGVPVDIARAVKHYKSASFGEDAPKISLYQLSQIPAGAKALGRSPVEQFFKALASSCCDKDDFEKLVAQLVEVTPQTLARRIQSFLQSKGLYNGQIDGDLGAGSRASMWAFALLDDCGGYNYDVDDRIKDCDNLAKLYSGNQLIKDRAMATKAYLLHNNNKLSAARVVQKTITSPSVASALEKLFEATALTNKQQWKELAVLLQKSLPAMTTEVLLNDGERNKLYLNCGAAFAQIAAVDEAIACYGKLVKLVPNHGEAIMKIATMEWNRGNRKASNALIDGLLAKNKNGAVSNLKAWHLFIENSDQKTALENANDAIKLYPAWYVFDTRGNILRKLKRYDHAQKDFAIAVKLGGAKARKHYVPLLSKAGLLEADAKSVSADAFQSALTKCVRDDGCRLH